MDIVVIKSESIQNLNFTPGHSNPCTILATAEIKDDPKFVFISLNRDFFLKAIKNASLSLAVDMRWPLKI